MKKTPFSVGQRWRVISSSNGRCPVFDFVIVGPPKYMKGSAKRCRLECQTHATRTERLPFCCDGMEGDYKHEHIKKYAKLVDAEVTP